ncbi:hypothetical protein HEK616_58820 [Streptomyces nigrescens]|uniref:Integral membrane protein n=1 Tax=Streptomyces nigrescens TaxID=1920 RepID=A0ABM8A1B3_STRNI|nr:hypothetical protein [Streptomyces nigrescens]BDM72395.1 hypothetical protein HEK616_58820 [Streptomyces nigrescens]
MTAPDSGTPGALRNSAADGPAEPAPAPRKAATARAARRGPADPVRALMHRHQALCAHAVDPLEIAAGLEAHGVTDRTAARFRHRDVFSLAEELYARVPRAEPGTVGTAARPGASAAERALDGTAGEWGADGGADRGTGGHPLDDADGTPYVGGLTLTGRPYGGGAAGPPYAGGGAGRRCSEGAGRPRIFSPAPSPLSPFGGGGGGWVRGWGGRCAATLHLLPGALCAATLAALASLGSAATPQARTAVGVTGLVLTALAVRLAVRSGPLRPRHPGTGPRATTLWTCWTVGYTLAGDRLLARLLPGGPDLPAAHPRPALAAAVALALAVLPAAGCARWFAVRGRRALAASRGLGEFATRIRPLLLGTTLLFLAALTALLLGARAALDGSDGGALPVVAILALGLLLFLARLLTVHGFPEAAALGLAAAAALEALAPALALLARLPGAPPLDAPVRALAAAVGPAAVPALACTAAALGLLAYGLRALTGACAHSPAPARPAKVPRP